MKCPPRLSALLLCWTLVPAGHAQTPQDVDAALRRSQQIQQQQDQQLRRDAEAPLQAPAASLPAVPAAPLQPLPAGPCVQATRIVLEGGGWVTPGARQALVTRFQGRCLGREDLQAAMALLTQDLFDSGLITSRVYLPGQDTSAGTLTLRIVEGRIERLEIDSATHVRHVFPVREGDVLNLRSIEQGIDQLNRLPSNRASMDLVPGSGPGLTIVRIRNSSQGQVRGGVSADNQGSASTGRGQLGGFVSLDNLLQVQDALSLNYRQTTRVDMDRRGSRSLGLNWSIPVGYATFGYSVSRSEYASTFRAPSGLELLTNGNATSHQLRTDYVLWRGRQTKVTLGGGLTVKDSNNYLERQFLSVSSRRLSIAGLDLAAVHAQDGWLLNGALGVDAGTRLAGALRDAPGLPDQAPRAQFRKLRAAAGINRAFTLGGQALSWNSELAAQYAPDVLYGSEQLLIGSLYSVRGFTRNTLSGDQGYYLRNELAVRQPLALDDQTVHTLKTAIGYDVGRVFNRAPGVPEGRLSGWFVSTALQADRLNLELVYTRPLSQPAQWFSSRESGQAWVRATWLF